METSKVIRGSMLLNDSDWGAPLIVDMRQCSSAKQG